MIKSLLVTTILAYSQVNFSNTPIHNEPQKAISESVIQDGVNSYEITLEQTGTTATGSTNNSTSYKRLYNQTYTYLNIQAETIYYNHYRWNDEDMTNLPKHPLNQQDYKYPYYKVTNWSGDNAPTTYYYSQCLLMLQITPYYTNIDNQIQDTLTLSSTGFAREYEALAYPPNYQSYQVSSMQMHYDLFTSTYTSWANYMGATTWSAQGYINTIYDDLNSQQAGYNFSHKEEIETYGQGNSTFNKTLDFNIIPGEVNYLFLFLTPYLTLASESNYPIVHRQTNNPELADNTIKIYGTGIIPTTTQEIIDIPSLMFDIVSLPWYFISTAFNLTLFPGTQYQINISNLFLAVIAVFIFIFLLKLVTGKS